MKTPFAWLAERYTLSSKVLRIAATSSLVMSIIIVLGGGIVRVTGSGLGCPTWPTCDAGSLAPVPALGIHAVVEFTNRMMTSLLSIAVAFTTVAARLQKPRVRSITRLAWSQFWLVIANAVIGGISVLVDLNPYVVAGHFLLAMALLTTTTLTWHRVTEAPRDPEHRATSVQRSLSWAVLVVTIAVLVLGTLTTGSGPHSGQAADGTPVARMTLDWLLMTFLHGGIAGATLVLGIVLWFILRGPENRVPRFRAMVYVGAVIVQGIIGIIQSVTSLPDVLVILHVVGAAMVWVGALRVLLDVNPELFPSVHLAQARVVGDADTSGASGSRVVVGTPL